MSLSSPSDILIKLEELKKWQERQQKRLLDDHNKRLNNTDGIEDVEFENRRLSDPKNGENEKPKPPPKRSLPNSNPEYIENQVGAKPKQPFLRKGAGLARFRMTPDQKIKPSVRLKEKCKQKYPKEKVVENDKQGSKCVSFSAKLDSSSKQRLSANLKLARAAWNNNNDLPPIVDETNSVSLDLVPLTTQNLVVNNELREVERRENIPVLVIDGEDDKGNETLASERELVIFETLEKRVTQNSFSSTNSSILRFLSSTPHKTSPKKATSGRIFQQQQRMQKVYNNGNHFEAVYEQSSQEESPRIEEIEDDVGIQVLKDNDKIIENNALQFKKIEAYEQKLQDDYLSLIEKAIKLKEFVGGDQKSCSSMSSVNSSDLEDVTEENTLPQFDDEGKWSDSESVRSRGSTSTLSSIKSSNVVQCSKYDAQTMTEDVEFEQAGMEKELKRLRAENLKVTKMKSEFEQEKKEFEKYKKEVVKQMEEEKIRTNVVLQEDKKKFAKEKMVFEQYVKDLQNKPSRKEREEISALKSKVATLEETLKLKETRSGTAQARLRNQIKVLEKKTTDLQKEVDNLTKQNAKLTANQNNRKNPSDTKILHQINKNLSKLAQEQLEKLVPVPNVNQNENRSGARKFLSRGSETTEKENNKNINNVDVLGHFNNSIEEFYEKTFGRKSHDSERTFGTKRYDNEKMVDEKSYESENDKMQDTKKTDRTEITLEDGSKQVEYRNGNVKIISSDGNLITFKYYNGDFKETNLLQGTVKYYYHKSQVNHVTNADGTELIQYPDGQTEKRQKDGKCEVEYPNGICRVMNGDLEEISYPDGTKVAIKNNGDRVITLPNGQRETHTTEFKRREYPDGTVKILYPDGLQETRYANGRMRLKDKNGKLLMDSDDKIKT